MFSKQNGEMYRRFITVSIVVKPIGFGFYKFFGFQERSGRS
jgi:hypothetical protein